MTDAREVLIAYGLHRISTPPTPREGGGSIDTALRNLVIEGVDARLAALNAAGLSIVDTRSISAKILPEGMVTISRKMEEQAVQGLILARTLFEELSGKTFNAIDPDVTYPIADAWAELHAALNPPTPDDMDTQGDE